MIHQEAVWIAALNREKLQNVPLGLNQAKKKKKWRRKRKEKDTVDLLGVDLLGAYLACSLCWRVHLLFISVKLASFIDWGTNVHGLPNVDERTEIWDCLLRFCYFSFYFANGKINTLFQIIQQGHHLKRRN